MIEFNTPTRTSARLYTMTRKKSAGGLSTFALLRALVRLGGTVEGRAGKSKYVVTLPKLPFQHIEKCCTFQLYNPGPDRRPQLQRVIALARFSSHAHVSEVNDLLRCGVRWVGYAKLPYKGRLRHLYVLEGDESSQTAWFGRPGVFLPDSKGQTAVVEIPRTINRVKAIAVIKDGVVVGTTEELTSLVGKPVSFLTEWVNHQLGAHIVYYDV